MIALLGKLLGNRKGAVAIEYGLIVALVVIASMGGLLGLAGSFLRCLAECLHQCPEHALIHIKNHSRP